MSITLSRIRAAFAVLALGLQLYRTPWTDEAKANPFYAWMRSGFDAFAASPPFAPSVAFAAVRWSFLPSFP